MGITDFHSVSKPGFLTVQPPVGFNHQCGDHLSSDKEKTLLARDSSAHMHDTIDLHFSVTKARAAPVQGSSYMKGQRMISRGVMLKTISFFVSSCFVSLTNTFLATV